MTSLCPEGCDNVGRPYCHCQSCGETGIPLSDDGYCEPCTGHPINDPFSLEDPPDATLPHACCGYARPRRCVCVYAYDCALHGTLHIGTHD